MVLKTMNNLCNPIRIGLPRRSGHAGTTVAIQFGAQTLAGAGATLAPVGTADGDYGDLTVASLVVTARVSNPTSVGALDATIEAGYASVASGAECEAALDAGANVKFRGNQTYADFTINNGDFTGQTITAENGAVFERMVFINSVEGVTLDGLTFRYNNTGGSTYSSTEAFYMFYFIGGSATVQNCTFDAATGSNEYDELIKRFAGIRAGAMSALTVTNCDFGYIRDAIVPNDCGDVFVTNNTFHHVFEDCFTGQNNLNVKFNFNDITMMEGKTGQSCNGTITGTIAVGELLSNGLAGSDEKILLVHDVAAGRVDGFYNTHAKPAGGDTLYGANGSIAISSVDKSFLDGIHGDVFQPFIQAGAPVAERRVEAIGNRAYRSTPYEYDNLQQEQNAQFLFPGIKDGAPKFTYGYIGQNTGSIGQSLALYFGGFESGHIVQNSFLHAEDGAAPRITIENCSDVYIAHNTGDNGIDGAVHLSTIGTNTNVIQEDNRWLQLANMETEIVDPFSYPQTLANLRPVAGEGVDLVDAGAIDVAGNIRAAIALPDISVSGPPVAGTPVFAEGSGTSLSIASFSADAGTDRRLIVAVASFDSAVEVDDFTVSLGAQSLARIDGANDAAPAAFERLVLFELLEADIPGSAATLTATVNEGSAGNIVMSATTVVDAGQGALVVSTSTTASISVTPSIANSLVVAAFNGSNISPAAELTGVTELASPFVYGGTATQHIGSAAQDASSLSISSDMSGRVQAIAVAIPPA